MVSLRAFQLMALAGCCVTTAAASPTGWLAAFTKLANFAKPEVVTRAVVVLRGDVAGGTVIFEQVGGKGAVTVTGNLTGLDANALRGMHIHQLGDLSGGCASAGPHYNPFNQTHGGREDSVRHVGDLGNVQSDGAGSAVFTFEDQIISLNGARSIIGRTVVLHAGQDDYGKGGNETSPTTGNAGGRAACGIIGVAAAA